MPQIGPLQVCVFCAPRLTPVHGSRRVVCQGIKKSPSAPCKTAGWDPGWGLRRIWGRQEKDIERVNK